MKIEVKKYTTDCQNHNGQSVPVTLYIGHPTRDAHPLAFQSRFLGEKGVSVPQHVMDSFSKLMEISEKNNVPFSDLVEYVIKEVQVVKSLQKDSQKATEISKDTAEELKKSTIINQDQANSDKNDNSDIIKNEENMEINKPSNV